MKSKSKFTVKIPSEIYKGEVFISAFFIVLNIMYTIFGILRIFLCIFQQYYSFLFQ